MHHTDETWHFIVLVLSLSDPSNLCTDDVQHVCGFLLFRARSGDATIQIRFPIY